MPNPRSLLPKGAKLASYDFARISDARLGEQRVGYAVRCAEHLRLSENALRFLFERLRLEEEVGAKPPG